MRSLAHRVGVLKFGRSLLDVLLVLGNRLRPRLSLGYNECWHGLFFIQECHRSALAKRRWKHSGTAIDLQTQRVFQAAVIPSQASCSSSSSVLGV